MTSYKIEFDSIAWESPIPGVRHKIVARDTTVLRLVEYTREMEPHWCHKGHVGYILEGRFEIEFADGIRVFEPGDGVFIPGGDKHKHKARVLTDVVTAIFVEDK